MFLATKEIEIYKLVAKLELMKIHQNHIICLLCVLSILFMPVIAVTTGNSTGVQPSGHPILIPPPTPLPTPVPTFVPPVDVSQNVGVVPIWLIIGIILIIIALSGLLWRYFHPKYVPKDKSE